MNVHQILHGHTYWVSYRGEEVKAKVQSKNSITRKAGSMWVCETGSKGLWQLLPLSSFLRAVVPA